MDDLWQQFHRLPKAIRDAVARPEALAAVDSLEQRYPSLDLASFIMRVAVKEFPVADIPRHLMDEFQLDQTSAAAVDAELRQTIFAGLQEYLGPLEKAAPPVEAIIRPVPTLPPSNLPVEPEPPTAPAPSAPAQATKPLPQQLEQITTPAQNLASLRRPAPIKATPVSTPPVPPAKPAPSPSTPRPAPAKIAPLPPVGAPVKVAPLPPLSPTAPARPIAAPPPPAPPVGFPTTQFTAPQKPVGAMAPTQEYSEEDAQEIAQQARRLQSIATPASLSLDDIAQSIIAQHHLAFHDELLAKRAVAILKARLKDIRNADETQVMLVRAPKVGGLGLDPDIAKQVVASLEDQAKTLKDRGMVRPPEVIAPPPPPARPPLQMEKPVAKPPLYRDAVSATARPGILPSTTPTPVAQPAPIPAIKRPVDIPTPPVMPAAPVATPAVSNQPAPRPGPTPIVRRERTIDRPAIADITRPMKTLGPAEEMRTMTLMEFRRLGQGANESTARLLEKFRQLQNESFTLWADALAGWRQSEVYQLYLDMGRQSLEQAMSISDVIKQRAGANQLYLSEHEFTALADFNRQLQS